MSRCHGCHVAAPMMCLRVGAAVDFFLLAVLCHSKLFISGAATWRWHLDNKSNRHSIYRGKGHAGLWNESGNEIYNPRSIFFFIFIFFFKFGRRNISGLVHTQVVIIVIVI